MSQLSLFEGAAPNAFSAKRNDVRPGKSGEHLVLAKLTRWGYDAHDAPQDAAYDIIIDHKRRVLRVQVKTRSEPAGSTWHYRVQRGNWRSATGTYAYTSSDYDIFAAVANGIERVLFIPGVVHRASYRTEQFLAAGSDWSSWEAALAAL
jgi:PD-(D/E)XK endonuclease